MRKKVPFPVSTTAAHDSAKGMKQRSAVGQLHESLDSNYNNVHHSPGTWSDWLARPHGVASLKHDSVFPEPLF